MFKFRMALVQKKLHRYKNVCAMQDTRCSCKTCSFSFLALHWVRPLEFLVPILLTNWCCDVHQLIICHTSFALQSRSGFPHQTHSYPVCHAKIEGEPYDTEECCSLSMSNNGKILAIEKQMHVLNWCRSLWILSYLHLSGTFTGTCTCFNVITAKGCREALWRTSSVMQMSGAPLYSNLPVV